MHACSTRLFPTEEHWTAAVVLLRMTSHAKWVNTSWHVFNMITLEQAAFDWKANIQAMQIINHKEQCINYSIKQSNSRINVEIGEWDEGAPSREGAGDNKKGIGNYHSLRAVAPLILSCQKQLPCLCFISLSLKMTLETLDFFFFTKLVRSLYLISSVFSLPRHLSLSPPCPFLLL